MQASVATYMAGALVVSSKSAGSWKVLREDRTNSPILTEYLRTGGDTTLKQRRPCQRNQLLRHGAVVVHHDVVRPVLADVKRHSS